MSTYVLSDIHGEYELFMKMLDKINFSEEDTLYVLGDVLDRGPKPIATLMEMMKHPNIIPMIGNHEVMAMPCLKFLLKEITEENIDEINSDPTLLNAFLEWTYNGCTSTIKDFKKYSEAERKQILDYLDEFILYEKLTVNDKDYILVHGGLGNFAPDKELEEYDLFDIVWTRPDYEKPYFDDIYVITGHTPTQYIEANEHPGYIYRKHNHIAIDCGACHPDGRLSAICLETGEEFYISHNAEEKK